MTKNAFITGATGFIGLNLLKLLVENGRNVTSLHRLISDLSELQKLPVVLAEGTITDPKSLENAMPDNMEVGFSFGG